MRFPLLDPPESLVEPGPLVPRRNAHRILDNWIERRRPLNPPIGVRLEDTALRVLRGQRVIREPAQQVHQVARQADFAGRANQLASDRGAEAPGLLNTPFTRGRDIAAGATELAGQVVVDDRHGRAGVRHLGQRVQFSPDAGLRHD